MAYSRATLKADVFDYGRALPPSDPLQIAGCAAAAACVPCPPALSDLTAEVDRLLPSSATPFERGIFLGAALVLALAPSE